MNENQKKLLKDVLDKVYETVTEYRMEYNEGGVRWEDYWLEGARSLFQMVWLKTLRLKSYIFGGQPEKAIDTIIDLIAYTAFIYVLLKSK